MRPSSLLYRSIARFVTPRAAFLRATALAVIVGAVLIASDHRAKAEAENAEEPGALLRTLGFSQEDLTALDRGTVISRGLDPTGPGEIAVAGAALVKVPRTYFIERLRDIVHFKDDDAVLQIGLMPNPPTLQALDGLTLSDEDLRALERCRRDDCAVKLSASAIRAFDRGVDWRAPDAARQADRLFKRMLMERTRTFLDGGPDAVDPYADGRSRPYAEEVRSLVDASAGIFSHVPEFRRSLLGPLADARPGVDTVTYWSKEKAAFKPIIALTQMRFYTTRAAGTTMTFGSSVNFYSSHYLDASIGATVAVERKDGPEPAVYVIYVNRSRVDALQGLFNGLRRWGVEREARGGLKDRLEDTRDRLESAFTR
jgi:hypothetical protein